MNKQRLLELAGIRLTEQTVPALQQLSQYITIIPTPPNFDFAYYRDYEQDAGYGEAEQIIIEQANVIICSKGVANQIQRTIRLIDKKFNKGQNVS